MVSQMSFYLKHSDLGREEFSSSLFYVLGYLRSQFTTLPARTGVDALWCSGVTPWFCVVFKISCCFLLDYEFLR